jgi:glutathione S-transferase
MSGIPFQHARHSPVSTAADQPLPELHSPFRTPILFHGRQAVWGTFAIMEYLAELFPEKNFWPKAVWARTNARAVSHEVHARYAALRHALATSTGAGSVGLRDELDRLTHIVHACRTRFGKGGKFLFGRFSIADAAYAPILLICDERGISVTEDVRQYMNAVLLTQPMASWRAATSSEASAAVSA